LDGTAVDGKSELASGLAIIALSLNTPLLLFVRSSDRRHWRLQFVVWSRALAGRGRPRGGIVESVTVSSLVAHMPEANGGEAAAAFGRR